MYLSNGSFAGGCEHLYCNDKVMVKNDIHHNDSKTTVWQVMKGCMDSRIVGWVDGGVDGGVAE